MHMSYLCVNIKFNKLCRKVSQDNKKGSVAKYASWWQTGQS